jgi:hypothetical protein
MRIGDQSIDFGVFPAVDNLSNHWRANNVKFK